MNPHINIQLIRGRLTLSPASIHPDQARSLCARLISERANFTARAPRAPVYSPHPAPINDKKLRLKREK